MYYARGLVHVPAVQLDRWQLEVPRDVGVLDLQALVHGAPLEPLCRHAARRDRRPAPKRLKLGLRDHPVFVHLRKQEQKQKTDECKCYESLKPGQAVESRRARRRVANTMIANITKSQKQKAHAKRLRLWTTAVP